MSDSCSVKEHDRCLRDESLDASEFHRELVPMTAQGMTRAVLTMAAGYIFPRNHVPLSNFHSTNAAVMRAWAISLLVHGLAAGGAGLLLAELKPLPEKEPFRWKVSRIQAIPLEPAPEAKPPKPVAQPASTPPPPTRRVSHMPPPQVAEVRPVETKPVVQTMQAIERPITRPVTREVATIQADQPAPVTTQAAEAVVTREVAAREATPVAAQTAPAPLETTPTSQAIHHASVRRSSTQEATVSQAAVQHEPIQEAPIQEAKLRQEVSTATKKAIAAQAQSLPVEPPAPSQFTPSEKVPVRAAPPTKADYGWLAEALWRRVAELKRYPNWARLNRLEGKVVVKAIIRSDGQLADVSVQQSSGHTVLDEAAMEAVRLACPLHMKHDLGKPQIVVNLPIVYSLAN
jgi:protein TonB